MLLRFSLVAGPALTDSKTFHEHSAQSLDREQKVLSWINPAAMIQRQSTGGDQAMEVEVIFERLIPCVQHSGDPYRSTKTASAKLKEGFADGFKEKTEQYLFVGEDQSIKLVR